MVEVDKCTVWPKALANLSPRNQVSGLLQQHDQDIERLPLQRHTATLLAELSGALICFENAEAEELFLRTFLHLPISLQLKLTFARR